MNVQIYTFLTRDNYVKQRGILNEIFLNEILNEMQFSKTST